MSRLWCEWGISPGRTALDRVRWFIFKTLNEKFQPKTLVLDNCKNQSHLLSEIGGSKSPKNKCCDRESVPRNNVYQNRSEIEERNWQLNN